MPYVRHSHMGDGPRLGTSLPQDDPNYLVRLNAIGSYLTALYAKLTEYAQLNTPISDAPHQEGPYFNFLVSPVRTPVAPAPFTPEQQAAQRFNLIILAAEHDGALTLLVAPTADAADDDFLHKALNATHKEWQALVGRDTLPPATVVYDWASSALGATTEGVRDDLPTMMFWPPSSTLLHQVEADLFASPPNQ